MAHGALNSTFPWKKKIINNCHLTQSRVTKTSNRNAVATNKFLGQYAFKIQPPCFENKIYLISMFKSLIRNIKINYYENQSLLLL